MLNRDANIGSRSKENEGHDFSQKSQEQIPLG